MTDTSHLSHVAEDLIAHHLQRSGLLVAKPKNDQLGTDLLVFAQIADGVKFCRVQCKGRTVPKTGTEVTIPAFHVTPGYVLFMYISSTPEDGGLYCCFATDVRAWAKTKTKTDSYYYLRIPRDFKKALAKWKFGDRHIQQLRFIIEQAETTGEYRLVTFGYSDLEAPVPMLTAYCIASTLQK
ncbi:MAG TPA: hypothetical protein PLD80_04140 [Rugosibacter sp.]|nr:hypothetical protein [Rugosibacter sp.]HQN45492.1 hypothetical protein [Rugosibacter sp.]